MNWEDEPYVRMYKRDTADLLAVGWEGRAVWWELLRKVDRAGVLEHDGDLAVLPELVRIPVDIFERGFNRLVARGCIELRERVLVVRNFRDAQEAKQSDKARQRESRGRRRDLALASGADQPTARAAARPDRYGSHEVTSRDPMLSQGVTNGHAIADGVTPLPVGSQRVTQSNEVISRSEQNQTPSPAGARVATHVPRRHQVALDAWNVQESNRRAIREEGIDTQARALMLAPSAEKELLARVDEYLDLGQPLEEAERALAHVNEVYAAEARAKRTLKHYDGNQWRADRFRSALSRTVATAGDRIGALRALPRAAGVGRFEPLPHDAYQAEKEQKF